MERLAVVEGTEGGLTTGLADVLVGLDDVEVSLLGDWNCTVSQFSPR